MACSREAWRSVTACVAAKPARSLNHREFAVVTAATLHMEGGITGFAVGLGHKRSNGGSRGCPGVWIQNAREPGAKGYASRTPGVRTSRRGICRAGRGLMSRLAVRPCRRNHRRLGCVTPHKSGMRDRPGQVYEEAAALIWTAANATSCRHRWHRSLERLYPRFFGQDAGWLCRWLKLFIHR